ncbi:hypothetical protein GIB67_026275 [Kingdonia uniflora]|uniref:Aminotransferase-like plant mobile domain-containing protein n=1 Tax=Kingdonia uniflora TaxID=39325 RepID=A0A7J7LA01_9MAGN|nr:hypothetical protein GIB67_026275 [Kingdonia uniflora]
MTITLEDVSRLIGLRVDGNLTVVEGKWGAMAVKEIFRKSMYLPHRVYPDLKVGGHGISFSLNKIVDFFARKVGTNAPQAASSSSSPIKLSSRMVGKMYMLYILGSFLFPTKKGTDVSVKYLSFFQDKDVNKPWSWGAAILAHLYYSLGALSRVNAKRLACCTTLLESWIFEHFPKLPGIPTPNQSGAAKFCTSPEHNKPYYPDRVQRQFNLRQPVPRAPTCVEQSGLGFGVEPCAYKPKYNWVDLFSEGKWRGSIILTRGRKVHDGIPVCTEGYFEWFNSVFFTKLCPDVVNLAEDDEDGRVLGDRGGVSQRENIEIPHSQNEGGGGPAEVVEDPARSVLVEALATKVCTLTNFLSYSCLVIHIFRRELPCNNFVTRLLLLQTGECLFFMEANLRMQADIQAKDVANSICEKKLNEKVKENETLNSINDKLMEEVYVNQEARPLPGVWHLALKGAIEGGDFEDTKDPTWEELSRQFTKLLTIAQESPKGEYEDDIILSGRGEYQEMIDSRLKKIDHKTNLRQSLFQPFNWFQLDIHNFERDANTTFRVAASYAYQSQIKFLNVIDSLCTLMTKKPSYWKSIFSQRLDVAYSNLGESSNILREGCHLHQQQGGFNVPTFVWRKANNKITKEKRFENIFADSTKYWWVGMTSDENFVKLKTKYQSPIPSVSTLWWEHVQLDIPDAFVKPCVKNFFDAPNEAWMKLMRDNNVNLRDYSINDLFF